MDNSDLPLDHPSDATAETEGGRLRSTRRSLLAGITASSAAGCLGSEQSAQRQSPTEEVTVEATPTDTPSDCPSDVDWGDGRWYIGDFSTLEHWEGLESAPDAGRAGTPAARLQLGEAATFSYDRDGCAESSVNWEGWPLLVTEVKLPETVESATLSVSLDLGGYGSDLNRPCEVTLTGSGWQTVSVPLERLIANDEVPRDIFDTVNGVSIGSDGDGAVLLGSPRVQRGRTVGLTVPVQSKPQPAGETISYDGRVINCSERQRTVELRLQAQGNAVMPTSVDPASVELEPGEARDIEVQAEVPTATDPGVGGSLPEGARERWSLQAIPNGDAETGPETELIHVVEMEPPYILHTEEEWDEIRSLVESEDWASEQAQARIERAEQWDPPTSGSTDSEELYNAAVAWQLSRNMDFAEKVATYLRGFADPNAGYPAKGSQITGGLYPSGGIYMQHLAWAYDLINDADVLTADDHDRIEAALRIYLEDASGQGYPGNQPLAVHVGGLYSALAIQDWEWITYYLEGPGKIFWQITAGIMDDGFWVEMSPNYMAWVARMFTKVGLAMRPWGVELLENRFDAVYHEKYRLTSEPGKAVEARFYEDSGIVNSRWGPSYRNHRQISDLWDTLLPLLTEDSKLPGFNDSPPEIQVSTEELFVAAYAYDEPRYLRPAEGNNLLYPVEGAGADDDSALLPSTSTHNAGLDLLRSQGVGSPREQYQALLSYGSHGGFHGHWDRLNMAYLRRFGKILTHTPSAWYGYGSLMYQFGYYQSSLAHNMLIVDGKNQYPAPSHPITFHDGELYQASAVENKTRWSNPRYGGHQEDERYNEERGVIEPKRDNIPEVPVPEDHPEWGHMNDYTEPIRSRRLMATTDEYVVLFDHVKAEQSHTYDVIYQFPNFDTFAEGADIGLEETRERFDDSPLRTGYFATDARFYRGSGTTRANFKPGYPPESESDEHRFNHPRAKVTEEMQTLSVDVHTVWPRERQQVVAKNPPKRPRPEFTEGWNTYSAARKEGTEQSFVTLIEVQEDPGDRVVDQIDASGPGAITVTLADGTTHEWQVDGLDVATDRPESVDIEMVEKGPDGEVLKREVTE